MLKSIYLILLVGFVAFYLISCYLTNLLKVKNLIQIKMIEKIVFSGVQPTETSYLGNYLGALKNFVYYKKK